MWAYLIKLVSLSKGVLVVGVASAAMLSTAEFSNAPSHHEPASLSVAAVPATTLPANSSSTRVEPEVSEVPAVQLPAAPSPASPQNDRVTSSTAPHASTVATEGHSDVSALVKECVERYLALRRLGDSAPATVRQSTSEVCKAAVAATGLTTAEFGLKFGLITSPAPTKSPAPVVTQDAAAMARECVTKYTAKAVDATATCKKAIELSGLTSAQFAAKYLSSATIVVAPSPTVAPKSTVSPETTALVTKCLDLYKAAKTTGDTKAVSDACAAAIKATGLSSSEFWAKYHPTRN